MNPITATGVVVLGLTVAAAAPILGTVTARRLIDWVDDRRAARTAITAPPTRLALPGVDPLADTVVLEGEIVPGRALVPLRDVEQVRRLVEVTPEWLLTRYSPPPQWMAQPTIFLDVISSRPVALDWAPQPAGQEWHAAAERLAELGDTQTMPRVEVSA